LVVILALATPTFAGAQYVDSAREQSGLGNKPLTGLGRNAGRALPLMTTDNQNLAIKADREKLANWRGSAMARSSEELPRLVYSASRKDGDVNSHSFAARTGLVPRVSM